jgi:hypothetical protein
MSEFHPNGLPKGKSVLCSMPNQRLPEGVEVGMIIQVLDTEVRDGKPLVRVRFGDRPLTYWISMACIGLSTDKVA